MHRISEAWGARGGRNPKDHVRRSEKGGHVEEAGDHRQRGAPVKVRGGQGGHSHWWTDREKYRKNRGAGETEMRNKDHMDERACAEKGREEEWSRDKESTPPSECVFMCETSS